MAVSEEKPKSDTETGFGTGLRAKLEGMPPEDAPAEAAPPPAEATVEAAPVNGVPAADLEVLREELAAALARERDLRLELESQTSVPGADFSAVEAEMRVRTGELDSRAARLAAAETALEERE